MVLVSLSFSRCVNFVGRGHAGLGLGLGFGLERFGLDNNTAIFWCVHRSTH